MPTTQVYGAVVAEMLRLLVPVDADASALEQELVSRGRRLLSDRSLAGTVLEVYTDGSAADRELIRSLIGSELSRQWVPSPVRFLDEADGQDDTLS